MPLHPGVGAGSPRQQGCGAGAAASWDMVPASIYWAGIEGTWQGHGGWDARSCSQAACAWQLPGLTPGTHRPSLVLRSALP